MKLAELITKYPVPLNEVDRRYFYFVAEDGFLYRVLRKGTKLKEEASNGL